MDGYARVCSGYLESGDALRRGDIDYADDLLLDCVFLPTRKIACAFFVNEGLQVRGDDFGHVEVAGRRGFWVEEVAVVEIVTYAAEALMLWFVGLLGRSEGDYLVFGRYPVSTSSLGAILQALRVGLAFALDMVAVIEEFLNFPSGIGISEMLEKGILIELAFTLSVAFTYFSHLS
jgi:hypothetical protein